MEVEWDARYFKAFSEGSKRGESVCSISCCSFIDRLPSPKALDCAGMNGFVCTRLIFLCTLLLCCFPAVDGMAFEHTR
jgi:hypothetical protein